jgi:chitinase
MRTLGPSSITLLVLATSLASAGALASGCAMASGESSAAESDSLTGACSLGVTKNVYDGPAYWGTMTIVNHGPSSAAGFSVALDVPSGAHCTNDAVPSGATLSPLTGSGSSAHTTSNHCKLTWAAATLGAGASTTFNYSTDSASFSAATNVVASSPSCASSAPDAGADGSHGGGSDGGSISAGNFPHRFAAPYVETWNDNNLANLANSTGHEFYTLAFVINGLGTCNPTWNGDTSLTGNAYGSYIDGLRKLGGDVIVSFGGADGTELGRSCSTVASLQAAYQKVITQFHLTWIDLDIESGAESDTPSIDRRNKAILNLQQANPSLRISYTLGVDRTGLPSAQLDLLKNAKANGARVDVVNVMAMDYGPCYSDMGQAAIDAASATRSQLASIGLAADVGVTPMIGTNDVTCEKFTTANAQQLESFAEANSYVRTLGFWAIGADPNHAYLGVFHPFH